MKRLLSYAGFVLAVAVFSAAASVAAAQAENQANLATPAQQYQAILKEFSGAASSFWPATNDVERNKIVAQVAELPLRLLDLVRNNPKAPFAVDALIQVISQEYWLNNHTAHPGWGKDSRQASAIRLLLRDHLDSDKLGDACTRVHYCFRQECETFLRTVLEKSPHREVQGLACLRLAQFLANRLDRLELLTDQPALASRYELLYGKDYLELLRRQDRATVMKEAEKLYEQALEKYADVKTPYDGTVGETAQRELFEIRFLAIGRQAEDIEGVDQDGQQFKLSDYRGKVVLLYFWSEF